MITQSPQAELHQSTEGRLAFLYEHPEWFKPIFSELERREVSFRTMFVPDFFYDIGAEAQAFSVLFNRMSPSADSRGVGSGIFHTLAYLEHLEMSGKRVINGAKAFRFEVSKAAQHSLIRSLGLRCMPSRVIHRPEQALPAAEGFRYPVIVKANIGGSGKGITRFSGPGELNAAVQEGQLALGHDSIALVQEYVPARGGHIHRVETLAGKYLYGIKVYTSGETFDLCPADICQTTRGESLEAPSSRQPAGNACVVEAAKAGLKVEGFTPSNEVTTAVERIVQAAGIDVGGVEYMVDDRDGETYYYDVNALSNFVADAPRVIGFNPVENLADYLEREVLRAR